MATCLIAILESFSNYTITGNNNDFQISYRSILTRMLYDFSSKNNFPSYKLSYINFRDRSYFYNTISYRKWKIIFVSSIFIAVTFNLLFTRFRYRINYLFHSYLHTLVINHPFHNPRPSVTFQSFVHSFIHQAFAKNLPLFEESRFSLFHIRDERSLERRRENFRRRDEINKAFLLFRSFPIHRKPFNSWHRVALEKAFGSSALIR